MTAHPHNPPRYVLREVWRWSQMVLRRNTLHTHFANGVPERCSGELAQSLFQVYLLHSWRFGANEVARPNLGKLADSCLMGARSVVLFAGAQMVDITTASASILETRVSAAYCLQSSKKRHMQAGESRSTPTDSVPECVKDCHNCFNLRLGWDTYGTQTRPFGAKQGQTLW
jgi:hypothetical protein